MSDKPPRPHPAPETPAPTPRDPAQRLREFQERFLSQLAARLGDIQTVWCKVQNEEPQALPELYRLVHSLAGSAGTFGLPEIGVQAKEIEELIGQLEADKPPTPEQMTALDARVQALVQSPTQAPRSAVPMASEVAQKVEASRLLLLIEDDTLLAQQILHQLAAYDWEVHTLPDLQGALRFIQTQAPAAVMVDAMLPEGPLAGMEFIASARHAAPSTPFIAISAQWSWESRLAAARAGADAYLVKPLDVGQLAEQVDRLTRSPADAPCRILVIDDATLLSEHYVEVLTAAGMKAVAINDPRQLLDSLEEVQPELVLTDLHMPECSGMEIARIIRQDGRYAGVPIVFLSTEAGRKNQLSAMQTGADDFLTKPIPDAELVAAVSLRVKRFRALTALIHQDSLTGLLNRITLDLQVENEIARARRDGAPLVLAMLDIDHFKQVNDTYGHPVGDRVIKSLAQLLRKRLRKYDVIGRYGGEEFSVLMPNTTLPAAEVVLNALREQFSQLRQSSALHDFRCAFSAGIAQLRAPMDRNALVSAADEALYLAKHQGRNQVCRTVQDSDSP